MFDYIKIDQKLLPYVENIKPHLFENELWQTKSLDKCLSEYTIFENIIIEKTLAKEIIEITDFHGVIRFYTSVNGIWYEFDAKFTDGKLVSVTNSVDNQDIKSNDNFFKK